MLAVDATVVEIAARAGVTQQAVTKWRRGGKPGASVRKKLEDAYGIPVRSWDGPPGEGPPAQKPKRQAAKPSVSKKSQARPTTLDEVDDQLAHLARELERADDLSVDAMVRLLDSRTKTLALKTRLERDRELLEDRIVREHPMWVQLRQAILRALKPYPEATKQVVEVLGTLEGAA